ncbi:glycosyltransferase [Hyphomicrobium sp. D-2]|uniref:glycosyltransferase n=1 Tax=Hyphomicrobium sp. D-2 TaxID=3041621 RepID=UPI002454143E|nr:glycosyltransferase [Hyphomicrobium sp. D-2]MDH4981186.1 glycosyltransferase [Hyphomicrobium sp. D-2]
MPLRGESRQRLRFGQVAGLSSTMAVIDRIVRKLKVGRRGRKPSVLLMADRRGWIFDRCAQALASNLSDEFEFSIRYVEDGAEFDASQFDLVYLFFWGERIYRNMQVDPYRLVKHVASHRWEDDPLYGPCDAREFGWRYLRDCTVVHCTSKRLEALLQGQHQDVRSLPSGFDARQFFPRARRTGPLVVGWAGNVQDAVKQVDSILAPACEGVFDLRLASGSLPARKMNEFYNQCDVIAVTSRHEGHPMPLIEGMAAGCFPVTTNVGVAPEIVRHGENGLIVPSTSEAFKGALSWCAQNLQHVRSMGSANAAMIQQRLSWSALEGQYRELFRDMLRRVSGPRFRNDDVSCDTPLQTFKAFCEIFWRHGYSQVHGVTLRGRTCDFTTYDGEPVPYSGMPPLSKLPNHVIRHIADRESVAEHTELVSFLNDAPDELALHGLYHVDHSVMSGDELRGDISEGLSIMKKTFPRKLVRYFIPPFNRSSDQLVDVCREFDLHVLGTDGVHLEAQISDVTIEEGVWYRYHHHRFYPESTCRYYPTTLASLDAALGRGRNGGSSLLGEDTRKREIAL